MWWELFRCQHKMATEGKSHLNEGNESYEERSYVKEEGNQNRPNESQKSPLNRTGTWQLLPRRVQRWEGRHIGTSRDGRQTRIRNNKYQRERLDEPFRKKVKLEPIFASDQSNTPRLPGDTWWKAEKLRGKKKSFDSIRFRIRTQNDEESCIYSRCNHLGKRSNKVKDHILEGEAERI